jgi:pheromone shutdown protein TraB
MLHVIGTVHISTVSAELSRQLVREVKPDAVFVELDLKRIGRAFKTGRPTPGLKIGYQDDRGNLQIGTVAEPPTGPSAIIYKILSKVRYKHFEDDGLVPGAEFMNAVEEGLDQGATIVLGDRDMDQTLRRIAQAIASTGPRKLQEADKKLNQAVVEEYLNMESDFRDPKTGALGRDDFNELIEKLKKKDTTELLMNIFKEEVPEVYDALVGERDRYMANNIDRLSQFQSVVAVMGAGHLEGVCDNLLQLGWSKSAKLC